MDPSSIAEDTSSIAPDASSAGAIVIVLWNHTDTSGAPSRESHVANLNEKFGDLRKRVMGVQGELDVEMQSNLQISVAVGSETIQLTDADADSTLAQLGFDVEKQDGKNKFPVTVNWKEGLAPQMGSKTALSVAGRRTGSSATAVTVYGGGAGTSSAATDTSYSSYGSSGGGSNYGGGGGYNYNAKSKTGYVGLSNQGATCYMNSLLQSLFMTPEFRNALYQWEYDMDRSGKEDECIPYQLQKLFARLQTGDARAIETTSLTKSFGWTAEDSFTQHDVQELCLVLMDAVESEFKGTPQGKFVGATYKGEMSSYVACRHPDTGEEFESSRSEIFNDINLVIKGFGETTAVGSLEEALEKYLQPEKLDGDNQYFCEKFDMKVDAVKGLKFTKLPFVLTFQLKRFEFDFNTMGRIKLNDNVTFPQVLDMTPYVAGVGKLARKASLGRHEMADHLNDVKDANAEAGAGAAAAAGAGAGGEGEEEKAAAAAPPPAVGPIEIEMMQEEDEENGDQGSDFQYELFAILIHSGSALGGHYYAYVKALSTGVEADQSSANKWFEFNDSTVTQIDEDDIKKAFGKAPVAPGGGGGGGGGGSGYGGGGGITSYSMSGRMGGGYSSFQSSATAYMLMYRRIDPSRAQPMPDDGDLPEHLTNALERDAEAEGNAAKEKERKRLAVTCKVTFRGGEFSAEVSKDETLGLLKEQCMKHFKLGGEGGGEEGQAAAAGTGTGTAVKPENVRLRAYNSYQEILGETFTTKEDQTVQQLAWTFSKTLLLEVRADDSVPWQETKPGEVMVKLFPFDHGTGRFGTFEPVFVRNAPGAHNAAANAANIHDDLKAVIQAQLGHPPERVHVYKENHTYATTSLEPVVEITKEKSFPFYEGTKFFLFVDPEEGSEEELAAAAAPASPGSPGGSSSSSSGGGERVQTRMSRLIKAVDTFKNTIKLKFNLLGSDVVDQRVSVDKRSKISDLKEQIAKVVNAEPSTFVLNRTYAYNYSTKQPLRESETVLGSTLYDGSTINVALGSAPKAGEYRMVVSLFDPQAFSKGKGALVSPLFEGNVAESIPMTELKQLVATKIDAQRAEASAALKAKEEKKVLPAAAPASTSATAAEGGAAAAAGDKAGGSSASDEEGAAGGAAQSADKPACIDKIDPACIRIRECWTSTPRKIYPFTSKTLKDCCPHLYSGKTLAVQVLDSPEEEKAEGAVIPFMVRFRPSLMAFERFGELSFPKDATTADFYAALATAMDIDCANVSVAKCPAAAATLSPCALEMKDLTWDPKAATTYYNTWSSSKEGALDQTPWSMQDGDFLIVKDKSEEEKALSDAERAVLEKEQAARKKASNVTTYTRPKEKGVRILTHQQREEAALKLKNAAAGEVKAPAPVEAAAPAEPVASSAKEMSLDIAEDDMAAAAESVRDMGF